jgi:aromatic-L-amino-acid decarboxylase
MPRFVSERMKHMKSRHFTQHGREVLEWIAAYWDRVESLPVLSQVKPGEVRARLPEHPPQQGESFDAMLRDVDEIILPGITHWQSPTFFGFFPANVSGPATLGDMLSSGLGVQGMLWAASPACTELETHVLDWLAEMLSLPAAFRSTLSTGGGVIQDTASSATLAALLAARHRATGGDVEEHGLRGIERTLVAYTSTQAHSSVEKAVRIAGMGKANLRLIETDASLAMLPAALERAIESDIAKGHQPCFVCATLGTTSTNAFDPVRAIGEICKRRNIWLHVDAAMSGTAAICPEFRWLNDGLELADSYCVNPHKWMLTNFDCDCFYVADRAALINAFSVTPEYLRNPASAPGGRDGGGGGGVIDYRDWQIPLGRRFRALKLWFVIRHYGVEGLQQHVREHVRLARQFAAWIEADDRFELLREPKLNLVCFALRAGNESTRSLLHALNASGGIYLTHTVINGKFLLRCAIGGTFTEQRHVEHAWTLMQSLAPPPP